jgi:UDP-N-acetylmuramate dehydrogenase
VLSATFRLTRDDPARLQESMQRIAAERKRKTPAGSSCGSVFKNPPGDSAGRLIERAGLKGRQAGGAIISPIHANYIVNTGGATAADILALIDLARNEVLRQFGVALELEVCVL